MKIVDSCEHCERRVLCKPTKQHYAYCCWRLTEGEKGDKANEDSRERR